MADGAQFAIEIAAQVTGGAVTQSELNALANTLTGAGVSAANLDSVLIGLSRDLQAAGEASQTANDALAQGERSYQQMERAADKAAKAAERAAVKAGGLRDADLDAAAATAAASLTAEATALDKLRAAANSATGAQERLQRAQTNLTRAGGQMRQQLTRGAEGVSKLQGALGQMGGPLAMVGQRALGPIKAFSDLAVSFGTATAAAAVAAIGFVALAAAVVVLAAAAAAGAIGATIYGVKMADAARSTQLTADALAIATPEFAGLSAAMGDAARVSGLADDRLLALAKSLRAAKVSAADLPAALNAAAKAERALGQGGADAFLESVKAGRKNVRELANEVEAKFGGTVARQMLSLDVQSATLQRNIGRLFSGLKIEGLLGGMSTLVDLFDENTASGKTLKAIFEGLFQPLVDAATSAIPVIEALFLGLLIGGLKLYIALKPAFDQVAALLGLEGVDIDVLRTALVAGQIAAVALALGIGALVLLLGVLAITTLIAMAPMVLAAVALIAVGAAIAALVLGAQALVSYLGGVLVQALIGVVNVVADTAAAIVAMAAQWATIGSQMVAGIAQGITSGAGAMIAAMTGAVGGAINAAKRQLGIASPSKVFAGLGELTGEGYVQGVEAQAPAAQAALEDMTSATRAESPAVQQAIDTAGGRAATAPKRDAAAAGPSLAGAIFNFYGVEGADDAERRFGDLLTRLLEGDALQAGA